MTSLVSSKPKGQFGDRIFRRVSTGVSLLVLVVLAAVAIFLISRALPALTADQAEIGVGGDDGEGEGFLSYVLPLLFGTVWASVLALLIAVPIAVGIALFITQYAHRKISSLLGYAVDLLAAIPSVVYGLWGIFVLAPFLSKNLFPWLSDNLGFLPFFSGTTSTSGRTMMTAAVVLSVMILPVVSAISREVFAQTPGLHKEAALALGATRWEMIKMAVLPYGRSGVIAASMLGLGRALGETMAVALILSPADVISFKLLTNQNPNTIASNIALQFPESSGLEVNTLIATGLVLFAATFVVNALARRIAGGEVND
ncbi:MAG: phosphate ABC transporter permease subunit PstC [Acidimicrobiia bacterium]|nr:phosphate ABC transporter permease subunit PstC [Acidimicrobiia bacterium]